MIKVVLLVFHIFFSLEIRKITKKSKIKIKQQKTVILIVFWVGKPQYWVFSGTT